MLTAEQKSFYDRNGYLVVPLFEREEVERLREHYMELRAKGSYPGDLAGINSEVIGDDPLKKYPRMIQMHEWDETSLRWLLDARLNEVLSSLLGREPIAVQTMLYFKPPGARGQALHQDNFYLSVRPGTCMGAWLALDACDEENGCMQVVPCSHKWPVMCVEKADTNLFFTDITTPLPSDCAPVPVLMQPGEVLFFNGSVVHGSFPNTSTHRFRRALIGHYIEGDSTQVSDYYSKPLRMDGTPLPVLGIPEGGPCGVWVERDGERAVAMREAQSEAAPAAAP